MAQPTDLFSHAKAAEFCPSGNPYPLVVVAYEDFEAATRIPNTVRHLLKDSSADLSSIATFWKFDLLNYPDLFNQALAEAVRARFIILSLHGAYELPPQITGWIERTINHTTGHSTTLVTLFDESAQQTPTANHILAWLESLPAANFELMAGFSDSGDDVFTLTNCRRKAADEKKP